MGLSGMDPEIPNIIKGFIPKNQVLIFDNLTLRRKERNKERMKTKKERTFRMELTLKSIRGLSKERAYLSILKMEIEANEAGDPRFHFIEIEEIKES